MVLRSMCGILCVLRLFLLCANTFIGEFLAAEVVVA